MKIWKEESFDYQLYLQIDNYFEQLRNSKILEYREGQHTMALDVMDAIKKKEILLIEAGVGSGKSWGYLVPLIYASQEKEHFQGFIISTSSIALQEQLKSEVDKLSEMLNIPLEVTIAKGKSNYICKKRLRNFVEKCESVVNQEEYQEIIDKVESGKVDRKEFDELDQKTWKRINVDKVNCTKCLYNEECKFVLSRKQLPEQKAIICNHDLLIESLKRDSEDKLLKDPSILIVDEAHSLEEKIRNAYQKSITKQSIEFLIYNLLTYLDVDISEEILALELTNKVFRMISTKAKTEYKKNAKADIEVLDSETSGFSCTPSLKIEINKLIDEFTDIEQKCLKSYNTDKNFIQQLGNLKEVKKILADLVGKDRKNIYWAAFLPNTKEHIELHYVPRNIALLARQLLGKGDYGKVFTSATMTTKDQGYTYFMRGLGLSHLQGINILQEYVQESPYDYDRNSILYLSQNVLSPKCQDHELYLNSLAQEIDQLIQVTNGRSLVLFTSKTDMNGVYERLKQKSYSFPLYIQEDGKNAENLKRNFQKEETSTLFATGSFWEGIDVAGSSLEQVIITKLPFPVVDPIMQEKASHYTNSLEEVYIPEMIIKLKQGAGRLIRSSQDKGIVSILDSRAKDYESYIMGNLPYQKKTERFEEVEKFAVENLQILAEDSSVKVKK